MTREATIFDDRESSNGRAPTVGVNWLVINGILPPAAFGLVDELSNFSSAGEVATFFAAEGIKGDRGILESCPISTYATQFLDQEVQTGIDGLCVKRLDGEGFINLELTPVLKEFIQNFDNGLYPELVR